MISFFSFLLFSLLSVSAFGLENPSMKISGGVSLVNVISASESVLVAQAGLESFWEELRLSSGLKYLRTVMMANSVGALAVTNINVGYLIQPGKVRTDDFYGVGIDYQIGGFNFGQIPMIGARLFGGGSFSISDGPPYIWEASIAGAYHANTSLHEIQNTWRCDVSVGRTLFDNVLAIVGFDYRDFSYRSVQTTGGYTSLSLLALSVGLGMTY